ncbi:DUF1642 domain-containing protein [Enterococcus faecium]|nr:DUF1642 domain-containing protein [Enterococcus faecium]
MNKQELIDKYTAEISRLRPYCPNRHLISDQLKYGLYKEILEDLKQLDEPQKPAVPKFVAEWIEYAKKKGDSLAISFMPWNLYGVEYSKTDRWIEDNQGTFARAWLIGYEVEKEPLYYVKLPVVYFNHWDLETYLMKDDRGNITIADNNDFDDMKFTESEIKAIDERYWPFAVPVEEVAEG